MRSVLLKSVAAAAAGSALLAAGASALPITVDTTSDTSTPTTCALRDAIDAANSDAAPAGTGCAAGSGTDSIGFTVTGQIQLGGSLPNIASSMSVTGPGPSQLEVRGQGSTASRVFAVDSTGGDVTISGLKVSNGAGGISNAATSFSGALTLQNVNVSGNSISQSATGDAIATGGGVYNENGGTLTVIDSTISDNQVTATTTGATNFALANGAAIDSLGALSIEGSTISGNTLTTTSVDGSSIANGAVFSELTTTITASTISGNTVTANTGTGSSLATGGGIDHNPAGPDHLNLDRDTISGNTATATNVTGSSSASGGGIAMTNAGGGTSPVKSSTIAGNLVSATAGGDKQGANVYLKALGNLSFQNTIVASPNGAGNCWMDSSGVFSSLGYNLISDSFGAGQDKCLPSASTGDQPSTNPQLGPLQDNGGPTETMAPAIGSLAVDKGIAAGDTSDQRGTGFTRTFDMNPASANGGDDTDIGAFEQQVNQDETSLDFGTVNWGATTSSQGVLQVNHTGNSITFGSVGFTGADPGDFAFAAPGDGCSNASLANLGSCIVNVAFHPASAGSGGRSAFLRIPTNVAPASSATLTGTAVAYFVVEPTPRDFGSTAPGSPTGATQFSVTNTGPGESGALAAALTGPNASEFEITQNACAGVTLTSGESCVVSVRFSPTSAGAKTAALAVTQTPGGTQTAALTGTATSPAPPPPPPATVTPGPTGQRAKALKKCKKKKSATARKKCKKKAKKLPV